MPREDVRQAAGELVCCGFEGTQVTSELREILREVQPAGLVLFARNVESPQQVAELGRELKQMPRETPLMLCIDQEGGRVARVRRPATEWPPMASLGFVAQRSPKLAAQFGQALGRELRAMNFDVNFAPVLDVNTNPNNPVIGDRAFGDRTEVVSRVAPAVIRGLQSVGVAAVGKHFPGHGDTEFDSHKALPHIQHELARIREVDWPPFSAALRAGLGAVMSAHVVVHAIDETQPATLSAAVLAHLRGELGFGGVIISDDLEMKAIADNYSIEDMAVRGMRAGIDLFLACHRPEVIVGLYRAIVQAVERKEISHAQLIASRNRVRAWRQQYYQPPQPSEFVDKWVGCASHTDLAHEIGTLAAKG